MKKIVLLLLLLSLVASGAFAAEIIGRSEVNLAASDPQRYGSTELALGSFAADALRAQTGADIAIVPSGELGVNLPAGDITSLELAESFPLDREICTAEVTTAQLRALLEPLLSHIATDDSERIDWEASRFDGFPQISGFTFSYDASRPVGDRITDLAIDEKNEENTLLLAASTFLLQSGYAGGVAPDVTRTSVGTEQALITAYLRDLGDIGQLPKIGRIRVIGARENALMDRIPLGMVAIAIVLFAVGRSGRFKQAFDGQR